MIMKSALHQHYIDVVIPALNEQFGSQNPHAVPKITKVSLNVVINARQGDSHHIEIAESTLLRITGQ